MNTHTPKACTPDGRTRLLYTTHSVIIRSRAQYSRSDIYSTPPKHNKLRNVFVLVLDPKVLHCK